MAESVLAGDTSAHSLMRAAHDRGYRYPEAFGGFEADLAFEGPEGAASGTVRIAGPRALEIDISASEADLGWLRRELGSMIGHRWHMPYEEADGANELALGGDEAHPLGVTVDVQKDKYDSSYRVHEGEISQVNRGFGKIRFSIQIQERDEAPDGRTLPAHFTVFYWDTESGRLIKSEVYRDHYAAVDGVPLPALRQIVSASDDGITTRRMELSNHRLLEASEAAGADGQLEYRAH